ncbi:MAG: hypothetical protein ACO3AY_00140 [Chitinophagaceae bacterium]|jgi:hypothetical protein
MKSNRIALSFFALIVLACNNEVHNEHEGHGKHGASEKPLTLADSLYNEVMGAHDEVMPKMGKVRGAQKRAQELVDSISQLKGEALKSNLSLKKELEQLVSDLNYADYAMDQWMTDFNLDSGSTNQEVRVKYLLDEKVRVTKVKEAILNSLAKADTLLKK